MRVKIVILTTKIDGIVKVSTNNNALKYRVHKTIYMVHLTSGCTRAIYPIFYQVPPCLFTKLILALIKYLFAQPVHKWMVRHIYFPCLRNGIPKVTRLILLKLNLLH